jgi:hypothetical protein
LFFLNFVFYKIIACYQWSFIYQGTFFPDLPVVADMPPGKSLQCFFDSFSDPLLSARLYHCLETLRAGFFLQRELPGLMRATRDIRHSLSASLPLTGREGIFVPLARACCLLEAAVGTAPWLRKAIVRLAEDGCGARASIDLCRELYDRASREADIFDKEPLVFQGEYAIEDTRHALLEAKSSGIHPFCITIDQHAHDYMAHMYGEVNYIFINDVRKLPARMPEIYRVLTS